MKISVLQYAVWAATFAAQAALIFVMANKRLVRRWRFLFSLTALGCTSSIATFFFRHDYAIYFYLYWYASAAESVLGLGAIYDILSAIPAVRYAPPGLSVGFLTSALIVTVGCVWMAAQGDPPTFAITATVLLLNRCTYVAWGTFGLTLFASASLFGFAWPRLPLRIALIFLSGTMVRCLSAYAMTRWLRHASAIDTFAQIAVIPCWAAYCITLMRVQNLPQTSNPREIAAVVRDRLDVPEIHRAQRSK
jgi:hypothetical protein